VGVLQSVVREEKREEKRTGCSFARVIMIVQMFMLLRMPLRRHKQVARCNKDVSGTRKRNLFLEATPVRALCCYLKKCNRQLAATIANEEINKSKVLNV